MSAHPRLFPSRRVCGRLALILPALLLVACTTGTGGGTASVPPTATATPVPTCASALPGATAVNPGGYGTYEITFPTGTVATAASVSASGTGLFTVSAFQACSPSSTVASVSSYFTSQLPALPHGWIAASTFPSDGGLMQSCGAPCFLDPKGGPIYYLVFDQLTDHGGGVITYRGRWAASPDFPTCDSNFTGGAPAAQDVYFLPGYTPPLPLPPLSATVPDDASGGLKGYDVCSPGDAASVTAFMQKELPATGWTQVASNSACFYSAECWTNGSAAISWDTSGAPADWHIAWREPLP